MIDAEHRAHLHNVVRPFNALDIAKALEVGIASLINWGGDENARAAMTLLMIHDQRGCEHLDTGGGSDRLTDVISVVVFG